ncbi:MAG: phytoene/squalene synthase family protein [Rhodoferax sp.]|nr:phytoene/squalene synthase family protein [Rhodoferax sp.]
MSLPETAPANKPGYDFEACQALMEGGSKTFFAASRLLPGRVRGPAIDLYAFCRVADDAIDFATDRASALVQLNERLRCIYADAPMDYESDKALAAVVREFHLPLELVSALLEGFEWDAEGRRYETLEDLHSYGARVAGSVGAMMAVIMRTRSEQALARACDLGVAMQLTNIARDIGEDARCGRLYLPLQWMREAGLEPDEWLKAPEFDHRIAAVVARLLAAADDLYRRSEHGIGQLPRDCRPAIRAARLVYAEIGRELERGGLDSINHRAVVSGRRKLGLLARACGAALLSPADPTATLAPLAANQFLVDAAMEVAPAATSRPTRHRSFEERAAWAGDLFERLARQDLERAATRVRHSTPVGQ